MGNEGNDEASCRKRCGDVSPAAVRAPARGHPPPPPPPPPSPPASLQERSVAEEDRQAFAPREDRKDLGAVQTPARLERLGDGDCALFRGGGQPHRPALDHDVPPRRHAPPPPHPAPE